MTINLSTISSSVLNGASGYSGVSGYSGFSGVSGYSGFSGSGVSGYSGFSGSGVSGYSGFSGISGYSGFSGRSGYSGWSGTNGTSGTSGFSGWSGTNGTSGTSGFSGWSGTNGTSGTSGFSGWSGISGYSGFSGSGISGWSGISGYSGYFAQALTFSTAGTGATDSYNGTAAKTISYNSVGAQKPLADLNTVVLGENNTGSRTATFSMEADDTYTGSDGGFTILRGASVGANGPTELKHRGTGDFQIKGAEDCNIIFYTSGTERVKFTSGGVELARVDSSNEGAQIAWKKASDNSIKWYTDVYSNDFRIFNSGSTGVYIIDGQQAWSALSDERLKYDVEPIQNAVSKLAGCRWVTYRLKDEDAPDSKKRFGTIAQDLIGNLDEVLSTNVKGKAGNTYYGVAYSDLVPVLAAAILEQQQQIEVLQKEINALKGNNNVKI